MLEMGHMGTPGNGYDGVVGIGATLDLDTDEAQPTHSTTAPPLPMIAELPTYAGLTSGEDMYAPAGTPRQRGGPAARATAPGSAAAATAAAATYTHAAAIGRMAEDLARRALAEAPTPSTTAQAWQPPSPADPGAVASDSGLRFRLATGSSVAMSEKSQLAAGEWEGPEEPPMYAVTAPAGGAAGDAMPRWDTLKMGARLDPYRSSLQRLFWGLLRTLRPFTGTMPAFSAYM